MNILRANKNSLIAETASQNVFEIGAEVPTSERDARRKSGELKERTGVFVVREGYAAAGGIGERSDAGDVAVSRRNGRSRGRFLRAWLRQYALALALSAGLHAALLLSPGSGDATVAATAPTGDAGAERVYVLVDMSSAPAMGNSGNASAAEAGAGEAVSREALSAAASAQSSEALSQAASDAAARALDFAALPSGSIGFDALGAMGSGLALSGGFEAFVSGGFAMGPASGSSAASGQIGKGMTAATFTPEPVYPELALREGREGVVELAVVVDASGRASTAEVVQSSGHADLDGAARSAVLAAWRFKRGGPGVKLDCAVRIAFSLRRR